MRRPAGPNLDIQLLDAVRLNWNLSVSWFLCTSFLYYQQNVSVISDETFDWLCSEMLRRFDTLEHQHKKYVSKDMLRAGTAHNLKFERLPSIIYGAASRMVEDYNGRTSEAQKRSGKIKRHTRSR